MKALTRAILPVLCAVALSAASVQAARNPNPGVLPPQSHPFGMTYAEWGYAWWQWALSTDTAHNPVLDTTGEFAWVNQPGKVFFLAGTFGGPAVERSVTVPAGTPLFWPVQDWLYAAPFDSPGVPPDEREAFIRQILNGLAAPFTESDLSVKVDGVDLTNLLSYRAQSEALPLDIAPGTICDEQGWYPPGPQDFGISDGFWVMLAPLPPGEHTIISRSGPVESPSILVTYHLTVKPGPKK